MAGEETIEKKPYESAWNLASSIIIELSGLLQNASSNYVKGNYVMASNYLRAIRLRITSDLDTEEKKLLIAKELDLYKNVHNSKLQAFNLPTKDTISARQNIFVLYGEYNDLLMSCLKKYKYLIPPKADRTKFN